MPLDEAQIESKGRDLTKAAATPGTPASALLDMLAELRNGVVPQDTVLRKTRIGVAVNKLRMHSDKNVAQQAAQLVTRWKSAINNDKRGPSAAASGASTPRASAAAATNGGASGAQSPAGGAGGAAGSNGSAKGKAKFTVPKEKRNAKEDGVKTNLTGNATRDACLKLMYDGLCFMSEEAPEDIIRVARAVEQAAYDKYQPETSEAYKSKMRSLFQNLKNKSNPELRARVYSGAIKPDEFVTYTHEQLKSAERKAEDAKIMKENMDKAMVAQEEKSVSTQLQCGKCGQRKVSYSQAQTRSADEPMTTFCECLNCGNRWKFS